MIELTVNGAAVATEEDPATPLLWVLRDSLDLRGTKYGCGIGVCGSCTVHVDGEAKRACTTSLGAVKGREVTTIEGLSPAGEHPVQQAWLTEQVAQCGYCQPGQIMAAAALLREHPRPTDAQIDEVMSEIVCRCGTYLRIRRAIHRAAASGGRS